MELLDDRAYLEPPDNEAKAVLKCFFCKVNYLKEILTFENWLDYNSNVNKSDIRLWYTLMYTANRFNWKEFSISISSLIFKSKLINKIENL